MATLAAKVQRSAWEMTPVVTYLSVMGWRRERATVGKPALAPKVPSPASVKRMAALGHPTPRMIHDKTEDDVGDGERERETQT